MIFQECYTLLLYFCCIPCNCELLHKAGNSSFVLCFCAAHNVSIFLQEYFEILLIFFLIIIFVDNPCGLMKIRVIDRNCEIPHEGPFCDLMWSDPEEIDTWAVSPRGAGWLFGSRVTSEVHDHVVCCSSYLLHHLYNLLLLT